MPEITFGTNLCFAVKRWPRAEDWAPIVADLGVHDVQFSFDLLDPVAGGDLRRFDDIRRVCERHDIRITSAFTGFVAYAQNLLGHPDPALRRRAEAWFETAIRAAARLGARAVGGHVAAMSAAEAADPRSREASLRRTVAAVGRLCGVAAEEGLEAFLWEAMPVAREYPSSLAEVEELFSERLRGTAVPVRLCIDLGHACRADASGANRDPYAWLESAGHHAATIHLQQTDGALDRHWPFTAEHDAGGIIEPARVLAIVETLPQSEIELMLEVIHPFEAPDDRVLADIRGSIDRWRWLVPPQARIPAVALTG